MMFGFPLLPGLPTKGAAFTVIDKISTAIMNDSDNGPIEAIEIEKVMTNETSVPVDQRERVEYQLTIPTSEDAAAIGELKSVAFSEKACCCVSKADFTAENVDEYAAIAKTQKIQHCRIVRDPATGRLLGCVQLQLPGDIGDFDHVCEPGQCHLEWIACHPDATGRGATLRTSFHTFLTRTCHFLCEQASVANY